MRNGRPCGASFCATCVGVKKNTRFDWNAFSTSATATPSTATPAPIHAKTTMAGFHRLPSIGVPRGSFAGRAAQRAAQARHARR